MKKGMLVFVVLLVVVMVGVAKSVHGDELIFPEAAALAFGAWAMERRPWRSTKFALWMFPTLAAFTGVLMLRLLPDSPLLAVALTFIAVALQLKLSGSAVLPAISAGVLPIVTHTQSWCYPIAVCLLTAAISFGCHVLDCRGLGNCHVDILPAADRKPRTGPELAKECLHWAKLLLGVSAVAALALRTGWSFVMAPPLIVAFVELAAPDSALRRIQARLFVLLGLAAFLGAYSEHFLVQVFEWPAWTASGLSLLCVFLLSQAMRISCPPAVAIAVLPSIIPKANLMAYPWQVLLGSALFMSLRWFLIKPAGMHPRD
jgi:uncharacterized membrane protein YfbV (UPF0208 family)